MIEGSVNQFNKKNYPADLSRSVKVLPLLNSLVTFISPPLISAISLHKINPSPVPCFAFKGSFAKYFEAKSARAITRAVSDGADRKIFSRLSMGNLCGNTEGEWKAIAQSQKAISYPYQRNIYYSWVNSFF